MHVHNEVASLTTAQRQLGIEEKGKLYYHVQPKDEGKIAKVLAGYAGGKPTRESAAPDPTPGTVLVESAPAPDLAGALVTALTSIAERLATPAPAPVINVATPPVNIHPAAVTVEAPRVTVNLPPQGAVRHTVERNARGEITGTVVEPVEPKDGE